MVGPTFPGIFNEESLVGLEAETSVKELATSSVYGLLRTSRDAEELECTVPHNGIRRESF